MEQFRASRPADGSWSLGTALVHVAFVLTGVMTTLLGSMLPVFSARWAINDTQAGYLFTAQFVSSTVGVLLSAPVIQRYGYRIELVLGLGTMATGAAVLAYASWTAGIVAVCSYGFGIGFISPTANLLIAELNPTNRAAALNWLNFSWGIGAVGWPFGVALLAPSHRTSLLMFGMAAALSLTALSLTFFPFPMPKQPRVRLGCGSATSPWRGHFVFLLGSLFFLYVGTENCIAGWIASYTHRMMTPSGTFWALTSSFFWGALLAGRALAPGILRYIGERYLASTGLLIAACGVAALLAAHTIGVVSLSAAVAGLGLAPVFPINIALLAARFGEIASRVGGVMFALAGLGGATLPWLVGLASTRFESLKIGLAVPLLSCLIMLFLFYRSGRISEGVPFETSALQIVSSA